MHVAAASTASGSVLLQSCQRFDAVRCMGGSHGITRAFLFFRSFGLLIQVCAHDVGLSILGAGKGGVGGERRPGAIRHF